MDWIKDYSRSGGWAGQATKILKKELDHAAKNKKDILHTVAVEYAQGKIEPAFKKLIEIFLKEPQKLSKSTRTLLHVLLSQSSIEFAEKNIDDDEVLERLPVQAVKYAAMNIMHHHNKSAAGRKKGLKKKEKVIAAWKARTNKKLSYTAWAQNYFTKNNGRFDKNGKAVGTPTPRTIARWVGEYEQARKKK